MYDGIIFDMDGTIWDSTEEVTKSWKEVVSKYPEVTDEITEDKLKGLFGLLLDDIAVRLFKSVPPERACEIIRECCDYENEYLVKHGARLFPGMEKVIEELSKNHKLIIVSNCQSGYIEAFFKAYPHLEKYFTDYECPGKSGLAKAENIRLVVERNNLKNPVYVGDTAGDAASSKKAGVPFIYARYGFGQVDEYDDVIDTPMELIDKVK